MKERNDSWNKLGGSKTTNPEHIYISPISLEQFNPNISESHILSEVSVDKSRALNSCHPRSSGAPPKRLVRASTSSCTSTYRPTSVLTCERVQVPPVCLSVRHTSYTVFDFGKTVTYKYIKTLFIFRHSNSRL